MKMAAGICASTNQPLSFQRKQIRVPSGTLIVSDCTDCSAKAGEQCVTSTGGVRKPHIPRKHKAMQAYLNTL
jgi:hypothetical protein